MAVWVKESGAIRARPMFAKSARLCCQAAPGFQEARARFTPSVFSAEKRRWDQCLPHILKLECSKSTAGTSMQRSVEGNPVLQPPHANQECKSSAPPASIGTSCDDCIVCDRIRLYIFQSTQSSQGELPTTRCCTCTQSSVVGGDIWFGFFATKHIQELQCPLPLSAFFQRGKKTVAQGQDRPLLDPQQLQGLLPISPEGAHCGDVEPAVGNKPPARGGKSHIKESKSVNTREHSCTCLSKVDLTPRPASQLQQQV